MVYDGYLSFGGNEVLNSERAKGIAESADCVLDWFRCKPCPGLPTALGSGAGYTYDDISNAPWYDPSLPNVSNNFYGVYGLSIENVADSTRQASVTEGISDGGVIGLPRRAVREIRVRALLVGKGREAVDYGMGYLDAVLDPDACGRISAECGTAEMQMYADCPPLPEDFTMPETQWGTPLTNFATNPSFETAGAPVALRTNLATNPSFEATTAATVEVRRNYNTNPRMDNNIAGWTVGGGTVQTAAPGGTVLDFPAAVALNTGVHYQFSAQSGIAAAGELWVGSIDVTVPAGYPALTLRLSIVPYVGSTSLTPSHGADITINPGETKRVNTSIPPVALAATADGVRSILYVRGSGFPIGARLIVANALLEKTSVLGAYFDGATLPAGDFTYAWVGTANASASVQYGIAAVGATSNQAASIQSTDWAASGAKSVRTIPTAIGGNVSVTYPGGTNGMVFGLQAGKTYTAIVKCRLIAPLAGSLYAYSRRLVIQHRVNPGDAYTYSMSDPAPNVAGVTELRVTFTLPAGTTAAFPYLANGAAQGGGDVWWDDLLIVEGTYTGPYFDGSVPAKVRRNLATRPVPTAPINSNNNGIYGTSTLDTTFVRRPGTASNTSTRPAATPNGTIQTWYGVGLSAWSHASRVPVSPGQVVTASAYTSASVPFSTAVGIAFYDAASVQVGTTQYGAMIPSSPALTWVRPYVTVTTPAGAATVGLVAVNVSLPSGSTVGGERAWVQDALYEFSDTLGDYFDGGLALAPYAAAWEGTAGQSLSYLYDPDFTYAWTGAANASTSRQSAPSVAGVTAPSATAASQYSTIASPALGAKAMRYESLVAGATGVGFPVAAVTPTVGVVYTLLGKVRPVTRDQMFTPRIGNALGTPFLAPKGVWTDFSVTVMAAQPSSTQTGLVIPSGSGSAHQIGDLIDIDAVLIVEGEYGGAYFDGSFPDSPPSEIIGDLVYDYAWTGAADASTSTVTIGEVVEVPDVVSYEQSVQNKLRFMRRAGVISGPFTIQEFARGDIFAREVEFTFAGGPAILGITRPIEFNPSIPGVVQDIPFNLAPYPSAELTSSSTDWVAAVAPDGGTLLHVPTHVSPQGGQTTHPSVLDFGATPFNGYRYWMAHTPYPGGNDAHEDPNIAASADGNTWVVPAGLVNPLDNQPGTPGAYNSDTELVVYPGGGLLMMWRTFDPAAVGGEEQYWTRFSTNGIVWSTKTLVHQDNMLARRLMSPTLIWENNGWTMWAVDILPSPNRLVRMRSEGPTMTPGGWTAPQPCTVTVPAGRDPWHVQIRRIGEGYVGLLNDCVLDTSGTGGDLYVITSTDGVTFTRGSTVAIPRAGGNGVGHQNLYRASLIQKSATQLDVWFAGWNTGPPPVWNIFRTTLTATLSGSVIIASNYAQNPSAELVEAGPTYTGWTSSVFIIPTGVVTLSRSTDIAAGGSPTSIRLRAAPVSGGNTGQMALQNNSHVFPVVTAGKRMSIGVWVNVARSGTATLGTLVVTANWKDAGGSLGVTTIPHALTIPGFQYISLAGIQPPVGADRVTVQIALNVASWSAGAIIDLYADTVLVSVP